MILRCVVENFCVCYKIHVGLFSVNFGVGVRVGIRKKVITVVLFLFQNLSYSSS
jgi:hypothetical protein